MNNNTRLQPARFAPPARLAPKPASPGRAQRDADLEQLKEQLLAQRFTLAPGTAPRATLRQAADEAASRAWLTPFPLLVLPALFDELADTAEVRARKQAEILQRSHLLLAA